MYTFAENNDRENTLPRWRSGVLRPVCLSVSVVREHFSGTAGRSLQNFCTDHLWPWLGPPRAALWYVMYFRFYGWRHVCSSGSYGDAWKAESLTYTTTSGVVIPGRSLMSVNALFVYRGA